RYTLAVRREGYAPAVRTLGVPAPAAGADFALQLSPFEMEPVNVTGERTAVDPATSPQSTSALSGDQLRQSHTVSLAQAIERMPGLRSVSSGAQVGKPMI